MKTFRECKYGFIALGISIGEITLIWGGLGVVYAAGLWGHAPLWLRDTFGLIYLAGVAALILAVVGLIKDSGRMYAALALLLGLVNLAVCGLPFTV